MSVTVPGTDLDAPLRGTLVAGVLRPSWVVTALLVVPFALGVSVPSTVQYVPLVASAVLLGLPHGAIDHLAYPRVRGEAVTLRAMGVVVGIYAALGAVYAVGWLVAPAAAFAVFILLTWGHWGQGDLYALRAFCRADYLDTPLTRWLAVVVRGGLPMLVPLLAFPEWYRRVADALVSLFSLGAVDTLAWAFRADTRLVLGVAYATVVLAYLALAFVRTADRSVWAVDAGETALLVAYFAVVPPVLAVGVYFCVWHAYRHIARLALLERDSRTALRERRLWPALARFAREATPLTLVSLVLLGGVYLLVPNPPTTLPGWVALYLVLVAVLTLPHVVVVSVMDREQSVWA